MTRPTREDRYLAGVALMRLHRPLEAEPHLLAARERGLREWQGWPVARGLLYRIRQFRRLAPPLWAPPDGREVPEVEVRARPAAPGTSRILDALPELVKVGRRIFGDDLPRVRLYLFDDKKEYEDFRQALLGSPPPKREAGTAGLNVGLYLVGVKPEDREDPPEAVGGVLHELAHAWVDTYLMDRYDREISLPWFDEGLAELVASLREPAYLHRRVWWVGRKAATGAAAPTLEELSDYRTFHDTGDESLHYWVSTLLVAELLGPQEDAPQAIRRISLVAELLGPREKAPAAIRRILDEVGRSGDVERAVHDATGQAPRAALERVVRRFWRGASRVAGR